MKCIINDCVIGKMWSQNSQQKSTIEQQVFKQWGDNKQPTAPALYATRDTSGFNISVKLDSELHTCSDQVHVEMVVHEDKDEEQSLRSSEGTEGKSNTEPSFPWERANKGILARERYDPIRNVALLLILIMNGRWILRRRQDEDLLH